MRGLRAQRVAHPRVYVDSNLLVNASRGQVEVRRAIESIIAGPYDIIVSDPLYLELLPYPIRHGIRREVDFLRSWFSMAKTRVAASHHMYEIASKIVETRPVQRWDALQLASATIGKADVFYTCESKRKGIRGTGLVPVQDLVTATK